MYNHVFKNYSSVWLLCSSWVYLLIFTPGISSSLLYPTHIIILPDDDDDDDGYHYYYFI